MKIRVVAIVLIGTLAGCNTVPQSPPRPAPSELTAGMPYELTPADIVAVKKGVTESLKDPTSALFGAMKASKSTSGVVTVCGYVNGKNSYGGYVGDKPYIGSIVGTPPKLGFIVVGMGGTDIHTTTTHMICQKSGIPI